MQGMSPRDELMLHSSMMHADFHWTRMPESRPNLELCLDMQLRNFVTTSSPGLLLLLDLGM
jgi:hypothetical protein